MTDLRLHGRPKSVHPSAREHCQKRACSPLPMQTYAAFALAVGSLWVFKLFIGWRAAVNSVQYVVSFS